MIGKTIRDRYRIEERIGEGGMAEVYRAYDSITERVVAIKLIKKEYCDDPQYVRRFEREANAVLSLDSQNIVRAYDYGIFEGRGYIVLEYVKGKTLKEVLRKEKKLSPVDAVYVASCVLEALKCAHAAGYVHRDVKPQNVLISDEGEIKLTDFGIAKASESVTKTFDGDRVVGSVQYISPEQASSQETDAKSDLYSVGIVLYEMLTGEPPFDGDNAVQLAMKHIRERVVPPREKESGVSRALNDVVLKATAKNRSVRYDSAAKMQSDLERALREPNRRFAVTCEKRRMRFNETGEGNDNEKSSAKLWHVLLPVALFSLLFVGVFVLLFAILGGSEKSGFSKVPDVLNRTYAQAQKILENREFNIKLAGTTYDSDYSEGRVARQFPPSGKTYEKGTVVEVWLSGGTKTVTMQSFVGMTLEQARMEIADYGITIDEINYEVSDAPEGTVVRQSIPEGTDIVPEDETIILWISGSAVSGATLVPMPDLSKHTSLASIVSTLEFYKVANYRFRFGTEGAPASGALVCSQSPGAGLPFLPNSSPVEIQLYSELSKGAHASIGFDMTIDRDGSEISVTLLSDYGEFLLYDETHNRSEQAAHIEFEAGYLEKGNYTCIVYTDGTETMRFGADFTE